MDPRIVSRTHYQVDEPAFMTMLCKRCVSASQSAYREVVAERLAKEIRARGKEFNTAAAEYAVDLAKALRLITDDHVLTDKGHLVNLVAEIRGDGWKDQLALSPPERFLYFSVFLEGDGAALFYLARYLRDSGTIPIGNANWNTIATEMFATTYQDYLALSNSTAERVDLRTRRDRLMAKNYSGKGGAHKVLIHIQTLHRIGLADRRPESKGRIYFAPEVASSTDSRLDRFCNEISDVPTLERIVQQRMWAQVASKTFGVAALSSRIEGAVDTDEILPSLLRYYRRISRSGAPLCPLSTVVYATQIDSLAKGESPLTWDVAMATLTSLQKTRPKDVRFHVDRQGKPAFVRLSDAILSEHEDRDEQ